MIWPQRGKLLDKLALLVQGNGLQIALAFVASLLRVRILDAEWYGKVVYLATFLAVIPALCDLGNGLLLRFFHSSPAGLRRRLFLFVLTADFALYLLSFGVMTALLILGIPEAAGALMKDPAMRIYVFCCLAATFLDLSRALFATLLKCEEHYGKSVGLAVVDSGMGAIFLTGLSLAGVGSAGAVPWLAGYVLINSAILLVLGGWMAWRFTSIRSWLFRPQRRFLPSLRFVFRRFFRPYSLPQSTEILFQFLKRNVAVLILGHTADFENLTYYKVLTRIFDLAATIVPRSAQSMLPSVLKKKAEGEKAFGRKFSLLGSKYILLMGGVTVVLYLAHPLLLALYGLRSSPEIASVVMLLCLGLHQISLAFLPNFLYQMSEHTRPSYIMVPAHNSIYLLCIALLAPLGLFGMVLAHVLHRLSGTVLLGYFAVLRMRLLPVPQFIRFCLLTLAVSGGLFFLYAGMRG